MPIGYERPGVGVVAARRHNGRVDYLATGEWVTSNLLFTAAFLVAGLGIVGIAGWVLRADRINRAAIDATVDADDENLGL